MRFSTTNNTFNRIQPNGQSRVKTNFQASIKNLKVLLCKYSPLSSCLSTLSISFPTLPTDDFLTVHIQGGQK